MARKIEIQIVGDPSSASRAFREVSHEAESFGSHASSVLGMLGKTAALTAGAAGLGALAITLKTGYADWKEGTKITAQTEAVLKSTGGAANVTAGEVDGLAGSLLRKSGVDDDLIKSGENMLLTFTNIRNEAGKGNDVFDQTTKTLLDMSIATGQDMPKAAVMLGKAINDPIAGIGALSRVGVTFTEGQRDSIKTMVQAGDTMGAQKVILGELNKEFGGSAEALGATLPGQMSILKESFSNLSGEVVGMLIPTLQSVVSWVNGHWTEIEAVMRAVFAGIAFAIDSGVKPALAALVVAGTYVVEYIRDHWPQIQSTLEQVWAAIQPVLELSVGAFKLVATTVQEHWPLISRNLEAVKAIVVDFAKIVRDSLKLVVDLIHGDWGKAWDDFKGIVSSAVDLVRVYIVNSVKNILAAATAIGEAILKGVKAGIGDLVGWVERLFTSVKNTISRAIGEVLTTVETQALKIALAIAEPFSHLPFGMGKWAQDLKTDITTKLDEIARTTSSKGQGIGESIATGVTSGINIFGPGIGAALASTIASAIERGRQAARATSPSHETREKIGRPMVDGVIVEWVEGSGRLNSSIATTLSQAISNARAIVASSRSTFSGAFGDLVSQGMAAFSGIAAADKTPAEKALEALDARQQAEQLKTNLRDAQSALDAALADETTTSDQRLAAKRAVSDAETAILRAGLEDRAAEERKQRDAQNTLEETHLRKRLTALQTSLEHEGSTWGEAHTKITKLLASFGIDYHTAGAAMGTAFVQGIKEALDLASSKSAVLKATIGNQERGLLAGIPDSADVVAAGYPHLASGGYIERDGLAYLHQGEEVVPASVSRGGGTLELHLHAGTVIGGRPEDVVRDLLPALGAAMREYMRSNGGIAFGTT